MEKLTSALLAWYDRCARVPPWPNRRKRMYSKHGKDWGIIPVPVICGRAPAR